MKTLKNIATALFLLVAMTSATFAATVNSTFALGGTLVALNASTTSKIIRLNLKDVGSEQLSVVVKDANANILVEDEISDIADYAKKFNFSKLTDGDYTLEFSKSTVKFVQPFSITFDGIEMNEKDRKATYKPVFAYFNEKLDVNYFAPDAKTVKMSILDENGDIVFDETVNNSMTVHKRFDLHKLAEGSYTLRLEHDGNTYFKTIQR